MVKVPNGFDGNQVLMVNLPIGSNGNRTNETKGQNPDGS